MMRNLIPLLLLTLVLAGCGSWFGDKAKPPLPGARVSVLDFEKDLRPAGDARQAAAFEAPVPSANADWPQAGGNPSHDLQHVALGAGPLKKLWSADIGEGSKGGLPLVAQPVIAGQSIFALDTDSKFSSYELATGRQRWKVSVRAAREHDAVIGGGIAVDGGLAYVTAGYGELLCLGADKGDVKWRAKLSGPSRAAPTALGGKIYVTTLDNSLLAFDAKDGKVLWEYSGIGQNTELVGAASAAATPDLVVPAFTSGELYALRAGNGSVTWSDSLANSLRLGGVTELSDIRGLPVIGDNVVYAISYGGKMAAIDLTSGSRVWQKEIGGSKTPWLAGNRIFLITNEGQMVALTKDKGDVVWVSQLAKYRDPEDKTGPVFWTGPVLAGGRLIAASSDGRIAEVDPESGALLRSWSAGDPVRISPIVAGGALYLLTESGELVAYK